MVAADDGVALRVKEHGGCRRSGVEVPKYRLGRHVELVHTRPVRSRRRRIGRCAAPRRPCRSGHGGHDMLLSGRSCSLCSRHEQCQLDGRSGADKFPPEGEKREGRGLRANLRSQARGTGFSKFPRGKNVQGHKRCRTYQAAGKNCPPGSIHNEPRSDDEATQLNLRPSHGTTCCPFPDESLLHVRCLRYDGRPQSMARVEELTKKGRMPCLGILVSRGRSASTCRRRRLQYMGGIWQQERQVGKISCNGDRRGVRLCQVRQAP